jgi:hypothetical protein
MMMKSFLMRNEKKKSKGLMERYLVAPAKKVPTLPARYIKDFWTLVARACEWPELFALTMTARAPREAAQKRLGEWEIMDDLKCYLSTFVTTRKSWVPGSRYGKPSSWKVTYMHPRRRNEVLHTSPYDDYLTMLYYLYRNIEGAYYMWITEHFNCVGAEKMHRFARITGTIPLKGPLLEWKRQKRK